jgi:hypothetical protein
MSKTVGKNDYFLSGPTVAFCWMEIPIQNHNTDPDMAKPKRLKFILVWYLVNQDYLKNQLAVFDLLRLLTSNTLECTRTLGTLSSLKPV